MDEMISCPTCGALPCDQILDFTKPSLSIPDQIVEILDNAEHTGEWADEYWFDTRTAKEQLLKIFYEMNVEMIYQDLNIDGLKRELNKENNKNVSDPREPK